MERDINLEQIELVRLVVSEAGVSIGDEQLNILLVVNNWIDKF